MMEALHTELGQRAGHVTDIYVPLTGARGFRSIRGGGAASVGVRGGGTNGAGCIGSRRGLMRRR